MWQGLYLGNTKDQCSDFSQGTSYQWPKENSISPKGTESSSHLKVNEWLADEREVTSTHVPNIKRLEKNPRERIEGNACKLDSLWKAGVVSVSLGIYLSSSDFHPCHNICIFSHIAFVFLLPTYFVRCLLFTIILRSVISMIYRSWVFILLSQFYLFFTIV